MVSLNAGAVLQGRLPLTPGGTDYQVYYDTDLDITWLANANLAATNTFGVAGVGPGGEMNWATAQAWIAAMNAASYLGHSAWRLPTVRPVNGVAFNYAGSFNGSTDSSYNIGGPSTVYAGSTGSEMSHLFYNSLGNLGYCAPTSAAGCIPQAGYGLVNVGPFANVVAYHYWSGTTYPPDNSKAWFFAFNDGSQWAPPKSDAMLGWPVVRGDFGWDFYYSSAQWALAHDIENPTQGTSDLFGASVSVDGGRFLVGSWADDSTGSAAGRAYLFDTVTGDALQTFENPTPATGPYFGMAVSLSGARAAVSKNWDSTVQSNSGRAYLFGTSDGSLLRTIDNPSPNASDYFGDPLSLSGDYLVVGADTDDSTGIDSGRAYSFDAVTGTLLRTLENPSPAVEDNFGSAVEVDGVHVIVGAYRDDTTGVDSGRAYLFNVTTGTLLRTFENPSPSSGDLFGIAVSISGGLVAIGASGDSTTSSGAGRAYVFDRITGSLVRILENPAPDANDGFGVRISLDGARVVVGAPADDASGDGSGRAYLFDVFTGDLLAVFDNPSPAASDRFGNAVSLEGKVVVIGADGDDTTGNASGRVYVFGLDEDGDGIANIVETETADSDGDGILDYFDLDSDDNGIPDAAEVVDPISPEDTDGDGIPDFQDLDNDDDGASDSEEIGPDPNNPYDANQNGLPDYLDPDIQTGSDIEPDPFDSFPEVTGVPPDTLITAPGSVTITGINNRAPISVTGGEYTIGCPVRFSSPPELVPNPKFYWVDEPGEVENGDVVYVRQRSAATNNTSKDTILTVGNPAVTASFTTTTSADIEPDPFSVVDQVNVTPGALVTSNAVTITGIEAPVPISTLAGEYSINCTSAFVSTPGIISNGQSVCVRHVNQSGGSSTLLSVGTASEVFSSTSDGTLDTVPDPFEFSVTEEYFDETETAFNVLYPLFEDDTRVTITGINAPAPIRVSGGGVYSIGCVPGTFVSTPGLVSNGQDVCVSYMTPACKPFRAEVTLDVGGVETTLTLGANVNSNVSDTEPEFFAFADRPGVPPSSLVTSAPVVVSGFDGQLLVTIPNAIGEYSIGCSGNFVAGGGLIEDGQSLCVRHLSAATTATAQSTQVKIGKVSSQFTSTTWVTAAAADSDGDGIPDPQDNCINATNGPTIPDAGGNSQWDADGDGYGNRCDGDLNSNGFTNAQDYVLFRGQLGQPSVYPTYKSADFNGNGFVNAQDYVLFRQLLGTPPGPSGVVP